MTGMLSDDQIQDIACSLAVTCELTEQEGQALFGHIDALNTHREILIKCLQGLLDDGDIVCQCAEAWTGRDMHETHCMAYLIEYIERAIAGVPEPDPEPAPCPSCKQQGFHRPDCETNSPEFEIKLSQNRDNLCCPHCMHEFKIRRHHELQSWLGGFMRCPLCMQGITQKDQEKANDGTQ